MLSLSDFSDLYEILSTIRNILLIRINKCLQIIIFKQFLRY